MKIITVAELRQNPTQALAAVEQGETYVVTRHRREIGRLVPPVRRQKVTPADFAAILRDTPLGDDWALELADARSAFDVARDAWESAE